MVIIKRISKRIIVAVPIGKRPRGRSKRRWDVCVNVDIRGGRVWFGRRSVEVSDW